MKWFFILLLAFPLWSATYYVDKTTGDDGDTGLTPDLAWETISKVNASSFSAGDFILFKRGEVWREQLVIPSSGNGSAQITFGAYGIGAKPIINGATNGDNDGQAWVNVAGDKWYSTGWATDPVNAIWFRDTIGTEVASSALVDSEKEWFWTTAGDDSLFIYSADTSNIEIPQRTWCIWLQNKSYITIDNLTIRNSKQDGIGISCNSGAPTGVTIDACTLAYNNKNGFLSSTGGTTQHTETVQNCVAFNNGRKGIYFGVYSTGSIMQDNIAYNNGIDVTGSTNANLYVGGTGAINCIVQGNTSYDASPGMAETQGNGISLDTGGKGNIVRYNKCYGNNRFGIMVEDMDSTYVYYNLTYNNTNKAGIIIAVSCSLNYVYNNVSYGNDVGFECRGTQPAQAGDMEDNVFQNNIAFGNTTYALSATFGGENDGTNGSGNVYTYNCFGPEASNWIEWATTVEYSTYDAWETAYGSGTNSVESDPLFTDAANTDFRLKYRSPCINAGVDVGLTEDFRGTKVPRKIFPDIGAYEFLGTINKFNIYKTYERY